MSTTYVTGAAALVSPDSDSSAAGGHSVAPGPEPPIAPHEARTTVVSTSARGHRAEFAIRLIPSMGSEDCILRFFLDGPSLVPSSASHVGQQGSPPATKRARRALFGPMCSSGPE